MSIHLIGYNQTAVSEQFLVIVLQFLPKNVQLSCHLYVHVGGIKDIEEEVTSLDMSEEGVA